MRILLDSVEIEEFQERNADHSFPDNVDYVIFNFYFDWRMYDWDYYDCDDVAVMMPEASKHAQEALANELIEKIRDRIQARPVSSVAASETATAT